MSKRTLLDLASGKISLAEAAERRQQNEIWDEEEFNETFSEIAPFAVAIMMTEAAQETMINDLNEAMSECQDYLKGQGMMNENFILPTNPRQNIMRLNRVSAIERLTRVFIISNARKAKSVHFKRYKIGMAMKKSSMAEMDKLYRSKSGRQALQAWNNLQKHGKLKNAAQKKK